MRVKMTPTWKLSSFGASTLLFLATVVGCAEKGWHAPRWWILLALYVSGVAFGIVAAFQRGRALAEDAQASSDEEEEIDVVAITSARLTTLGLASMIGSMTGLAGAVLLARLMADWTALVPASIMSAFYVATLPLHIIAAHAVFERKLHLGVDGVRIGRRVIAYRTLRTVSSNANVVELTLTDGRQLSHRCATNEIAQAIVARIAPKISATTGTTRVGREGRTLEAWKRELSSPDYRANQISTEDATRILEAGAASPDERVGAALVLKSRSDDDALERIRIAASACIDDDLRVALERVADDTIDDETLRKLGR